MVKTANFVIYFTTIKNALMFSESIIAKIGNNPNGFTLMGEGINKLW